MRVFLTDCCCHEVKIINLILAEVCPATKLNSFHLGYFPTYLSYKPCKFVFFCIVYCLLSRLQHQYAQAATYISFRTGNLHFEASIYKARWLHQQCNTNRCGQYTLQSLLFYYLPITNNKSKNIILLSLKLSEIATFSGSCSQFLQLGHA